MSRLIDADAFVTVQLYDDEHEEEYEERMTIAEAIDRYTSEGCPPTIDAVSVVRGEWKPLRGRYAECSACEEAYYMPHMRWSNFCPCCGARMKGADNEASD